jgi:hypothetical protein
MDESEDEIISHGAEYVEYRLKGKEILSLKVLKSLITL